MAPALSAQEYHPALDPKLFPVAESLRPAVDFWHAIWSKHSSREAVIHDNEHLGVVYSVVDANDLYDVGLNDIQVAKQRQKRVDDELDRVKAVLRELAGMSGPKVDEGDVARVRYALRNVPGDDRSKYRAAISRVRAQTGQSDRFAEAIRISGMFMPRIERILEERGLPIVIARLPFVESMFNYRARSKVGASGAWQFTASTGRMFLQMDSAVDARSDVLLAAEGAAKKLAREFDSLKTWPITLTAYNHGAAGMARAVRETGTRDIAVIIEKYKGRRFGFASRNFYPEFVAAVAVYEDREELFPGISPMPELRFDEFTAPRYFSLLDLAQITQSSLSELGELNPALAADVVRGDLLVPPGYPLRVPAGAARAFRAAYDRLPAERTSERQLATEYRVQRGDTLGGIASRFGVSVAALQRANSLPRADRIYVGQRLEVPSSSSWTPITTDLLAQISVATLVEPVATNGDPAPDTFGAPTRAEPSEHVVARGETVSRIAAKYGVTVEAIVQANGIRSADSIAIGQRLVIPPAGSTASRPQTHRVRAGENLSLIAERYGTTVRALMDHNGLRSTVLQIGQVLRIPS
ncbi:MAG TPA: LysM peptidoglycan-binding domain-containing protein [Thermoanaerobaculia bacterium]|nr:LysM peptidoglycan-binding domain-containing protein [Thermoanaerobaculia bacterium]